MYFVLGLFSGVISIAYLFAMSTASDATFCYTFGVIAMVFMVISAYTLHLYGKGD